MESGKGDKYRPTYCCQPYEFLISVRYSDLQRPLLNKYQNLVLASQSLLLHLRYGAGLSFSDGDSNILSEEVWHCIPADGRTSCMAQFLSLLCTSTLIPLYLPVAAPDMLSESRLSAIANAESFLPSMIVAYLDPTVTVVHLVHGPQSSSRYQRVARPTET